MNQITYRSLQLEDYPTIKKLIGEAFNFSKFIEDPKILDSCLTIYLNSCLAETSFSSVAVKNNEVVGLIFGHSKEDKHIVSTFKAYSRILYHALALSLYNKKSRMILSQFKKITDIYKTLSSATSLNFGGSVTLFIVSPTCQGYGVGKTLLEQLITYMKAQKINDFYLYTDTNCNYGFYDHQGFKRLATQTTHFFDNLPALDMFLYGYHLDSYQNTTIR